MHCRYKCKIGLALSIDSVPVHALSRVSNWVFILCYSFHELRTSIQFCCALQIVSVGFSSERSTVLVPRTEPVEKKEQDRLPSFLPPPQHYLALVSPGRN